jgi:hypothetical protein
VKSPNVYGVTICAMANLTGLANIIAELKVERASLMTQLRHVDAALTVLGKLPGGSSYTRPRRTMSAAARRRISAAQKARWAKQKSAAQNTPGSARPKRHISAAGIARIRAAAKARWARVRAEKKK